jgi:excisionase family DNA binding protein
MTPLFTRRELAEYLKVSPSTIDRLCRARKLCYTRIASRKRFTYDDVLAFINSRSLGHRADPSSPASQ